MNLEVSALHRLPFDEARFAEESEAIAADSDERKELEMQSRENWQNAWIVVVEYAGDGELDFSQFSHPETGPNSQAAWLEQELESNGDKR